MPPGDPSAETSAARVAGAQTGIKRGDLRADTDLELALDVLREPLILRASTNDENHAAPSPGRGVYGNLHDCEHP